jgi:hypothetical protein
MEVNNNNNNKETKMQNITNSTQYDEYLRSHVKHYIVTIFKGRGKYGKVAFDSLADAIEYRNSLKSANPLCRCIVYGISQPPHTIMSVTIEMGV